MSKTKPNLYYRTKASKGGKGDTLNETTKKVRKASYRQQFYTDGHSTEYKDIIGKRQGVTRRKTIRIKTKLAKNDHLKRNRNVNYAKGKARPHWRGKTPTSTDNNTG